MFRIILGLGLVSTAWAGPFRVKTPPAEPEAPVMEEVTLPALPSWTDLFSETPVPTALGPVPEGLPSVSAQTCNACHGAVHDGWASSAHATTPHLEAVRKMSTELQAPQCLSCHRPLDVQHPNIPEPAESAATPAHNPSWQPTLEIEGVTCAACHVRQGTIIAADAFAQPPAAHAKMAHSSDLTDSTACANCHQLTWPGASSPLYDTYGEWERSAHGRSGIGCVDCHGAGNAGGSHRLDVPFERALTVDLQLSAAVLVRGAEPALSGTLTVLNTGAGHAVPTGSPWSPVELHVSLVHGDGASEPVSVISHSLGRTLSQEPPWQVEQDTRLQSGGSLELQWQASLPAEAPAGSWFVQVHFIRPSDAANPPLWQKQYPIQVE